MSAIPNLRFYEARVTGFRSELEFQRLIAKRKIPFLDGGQFLFGKKEEGAPENFIAYVTVTDQDKKKYTRFYHALSSLKEVRGMFFVAIEDTDKWETVNIEIKDENGRRVQSEILEPLLSVFRFDSGKWVDTTFDEIKRLFETRRPAVAGWKPYDRFQYLLSYSPTELVKIYCNRFVLDVTLSGLKKGMLDFDGILPEDDKFIIVETKEKAPMRKDPADKNTWSFGWDSRRLSWYLYLKSKLGFETWYVIREVSDETHRNFVGWKKIELDRFCECTSWLQERAGGGGGGTVEAPYMAFEEL
jgi:hypothetical protein